MKKVNEIFYSLQGEGHFTGTPAVFIRFSGCNLKCDFCDTQHTNGIWMKDEEIINKISSFPARHTVLTGGEPALHITPGLISLLKKNGWFVQIETNGTKKLPEGIDWITCSPKSNSHTVIKTCHELKVVYTNQDMEQYNDYRSDVRYLQPCSGKNTKEVIDYILSHPEWKLSLQTHKITGIP